MDVQFSLFVFAKDDRSMELIETPDRVLCRLEAIDIENDEYLFWDSTGLAVSISMTGKAVKHIDRCDQVMPLREAFEKYADSYGLQVIDAKTPIDTWKNLQTQLPPKKTPWERLTGKSKT